LGSLAIAGRRRSRAVRVGAVVIGAGSPVTIQSMTKTDTRDIDATVAEIHALESAGCDLARVAVPDQAAAKALGAIRSQIAIPLVADVHFDAGLALEALAQGVDKLRINPGNLRRREDVIEVAAAARERGVPIRVGANAGSLPPPVAAKWEARAERGLPAVDAQAHALVESALAQARLLEKTGFRDIVLSLKAFDVPVMIRAYRLAAAQTDYPLHLGVTEAGLEPEGSLRSAVGIGALLADGIGDTIRVSLTAPAVEEVRVGREILRALGLREGGVTIIACPTCGRCEIDLSGLAHQVSDRLASLHDALAARGRGLRIAVMGCIVNGPGEARQADLGIAGGRGEAVLFRRGEVIARTDERDVLDAVVAEAEALAGLDSGASEEA
jgi:(E)-4-hydroxy-3-methylbut-2-enyl-diphosphate synthase